MASKIAAEGDTANASPAAPRSKTLQASRDLKPDAQAFDEVRIKTSPRYKQSGLSGDEWRISAVIQLMRKGRVVVETSCRNIEVACGRLAAFHGDACNNGHAFFAGEGELCDQEGCCEPATVTYKKLADYCRDGHRTEIPQHQMKVRKFCSLHARRGDCGLDDADRNYEPLAEQEQPR